LATPDPLERLAAARPTIAFQTSAILDEGERGALVESIVDGPPRVRRPQKSRLRRRSTWALSLIAGAAAVVAVVLVLAPVHSSDAAAAIVARATRVIDHHTNGVFVLHQIQYGGRPSTVDGWYDARNDHHFRLEFRDPTGTEQVGGEYPFDGHTVSITVDPSNRSVSILSLPTSKLPKAAPEGSVTKIKAALRSGAVTYVGHQTIDGQDTLHLVSHTAHDVFDIWINAATYEVVRTRDVGNGVRSVGNVTWLPPTPANLALLTVTIPPGYRVSGSPADQPISLPQPKTQKHHPRT
jgi:hypothetical protein